MYHQEGLGFYRGLMANKHNGGRLLNGGRLGIDWSSLRPRQRVKYKGTASGIKNNVCRANKIHAPKQFRWEWYAGQMVVERVQ